MIDTLDMLESGRVKRFHTQFTVGQQDVAQHVYQVLWFVYALAGERPSHALMLHALAHDGGEVETGDMPGHTKLALGLTKEMDALEDKFLQNLGVHLPPLTEQDAALLKLADVLSGLHFSWKEVKRRGNLEMQECYVNYLRYATEMTRDGRLMQSAAAIGKTIIGEMTT